jgi:hypothetical protein
MYVRRKVFSIANDYDDFDNSYDEFDDYFSQKLYSEAFEDGIDYAIEKMFADKLPPANSPLAIGPAGDPGLRGNYEKSLWDKIKGLPKSVKDRYMKAGKWGKAGMIAAAAAPVLAAAGYGIHKATKKDKTYSEGFEAGIDYAIEKLFFDPENMSNSEYNDLINRTKEAAKKAAKEKAAKEAEKVAKENKKKVEQAFVNMYEQHQQKQKGSSNLPAVVGKGSSNLSAVVGKGKDNPVSGAVDAKYYEDLYRKGEISRKELESALETARGKNGVLQQGLREANKKNSVLAQGLKAAEDKVEGFKTAFNTEQMLHDNTRKAKEAAEKLAKRWKYGAIGAGVAGAGIGTAGFLRGRRRDRD